MNNKLHVSKYNKTITRETNQQPNENKQQKHTVQMEHWMLNLDRLISVYIH